MLADLGDPSRSRWQLTTGQSGQPGSPHYDDIIGGWRTGMTNPVYFEEHEWITVLGTAPEDGPSRMVVSFHGMPEGLQRHGKYLGGTVVSVDEALRFAVVASSVSRPSVPPSTARADSGRYQIFR